MRYFLTQNTAVEVKIDGHIFKFEDAEYFAPSNSYWGILATDKSEDIALLEKAVATKRIQEISDADYTRLDSKKKRLRQGNPNLIALQPSPLRVKAEPERVAEVAGTGEVDLESAEDALTPQPAVRRVSASVRKAK